MACETGFGSRFCSVCKMCPLDSDHGTARREIMKDAVSRVVGDIEHFTSGDLYDVSFSQMFFSNTPAAFELLKEAVVTMSEEKSSAIASERELTDSERTLFAEFADDEIVSVLSKSEYIICCLSVFEPHWPRFLNRAMLSSGGGDGSVAESFLKIEQTCVDLLVRRVRIEWEQFCLELVGERAADFIVFNSKKSEDARHRFNVKLKELGFNSL